MPGPVTNEDAVSLALQALVWTLNEPDRADRLLAVTGLDPDDLRSRVGEPAVLSAALGVSPQALVAAHYRLEQA